MTKKAKPIKEPIVVHEGRFYILPDFYSGKLNSESVLILHPLNEEETETLVYLREAHLREAYASVLPKVQKRALEQFTVEPADADEGDGVEES